MQYRSVIAGVRAWRSLGGDGWVGRWCWISGGGRGEGAIALGSGIALAHLPSSSSTGTHAICTLCHKDLTTIMVNYSPETVSM